MTKEGMSRNSPDRNASWLGLWHRPSWYQVVLSEHHSMLLSIMTTAGRRHDQRTVMVEERHSARDSS
jgi:hypothetical protein